MSEARKKTIVPQASPGVRGARLRAGTEGVHELLAFRLASETYALPLASVREILRPPPITEVPRAASDVLGIVSVRGRITTVIDLRRRLDMPEAPATKQARVLVVESGDESFGLLVDSVAHVYRLFDDEIELAAAVGGDLADYVIGVARPRPVARSAADKAVVSPSPVSARRTGALELRGPAPVAADEIIIVLDPTPLLRR